MTGFVINKFPNEEQRAVRKLRTSSLRITAILALTLNIVLGQGDFWIHIGVTISYVLACALYAVVSALILSDREYKSLVVVVDALFVVAVLYQHILATSVTDDHSVTATGLVIAFILLIHTALNLQRRLIFIYSGIVAISWVAMIAIMAWRHESLQAGTFVSAFLNVDLALAMSFAFTGWAVCILVSEQEEAKREAAELGKRRSNLSRFFSPFVVSYLENDSAHRSLQRRHAAIMFVDLRDFTTYAESASASQLASVLAEYRDLVANVIFQFGGTIDKFVGDGVMAVFGQPKPSDGDAAKALACAMHLIQVLSDWRHRRLIGQQVAFDAVIGLHFGLIVGGVLKSGTQDEFTVVGDAVNVAQRLEGIAKSIDASLVVSTSLLESASIDELDGKWVLQQDVLLPGRRNPIDIAYIPRLPANCDLPRVISSRLD
ncbi:adenylate/guanylate cyclase domain-containing protein [Hoeflea sp. CAU 1731]